MIRKKNQTIREFVAKTIKSKKIRFKFFEYNLQDLHLSLN